MSPTKPEEKPAAKPAGDKPAAAKPAAAKPAAAKPSAAKPAAGKSKPAAAKPAADKSKPAAAKPATAKRAATKDASGKPTDAKRAATKDASGKPAPAKRAAAKPKAGKSAASKSGKPGAGKSAASKSGKPGAGKSGKPGAGKSAKSGAGKSAKSGAGKSAASKSGKSGAGKPAAPKRSKFSKPDKSAAIKKLHTVKDGKVQKLKSKKGRVGKPRNYDLGNGVYRFSRTRMYHKKAKYKFVGIKNTKAKKPKKPIFIEKPIGGEKNGGKRIVFLKKKRNYYPTAKKINRHPSKKMFSQHTRYTRRTLTPGTICILLAGRHKGKRVVLLKVLSSGLLLVTGPFRINGCPLRRISQNYVIATKTKLDISKVKIPNYLDDKYFRRIKAKRQKKEEGDIFASKKEGYKVSDKRKLDQKQIDKEVIAVIRKHPDKTIVIRYLAAMFGLKKTQFPHRLIF